MLKNITTKKLNKNIFVTEKYNTIMRSDQVNDWMVTSSRCSTIRQRTS